MINDLAMKNLNCYVHVHWTLGTWSIESNPWVESHKRPIPINKSKLNYDLQAIGHPATHHPPTTMQHLARLVRIL